MPKQPERASGDPWDDDPEFDEADDDELEFDCGWSPASGGCSMAGSEDCDFECPYREDMVAQLTQRTRRK